MKRAVLMMLALLLQVQVAWAAPVTVVLQENFPNHQGENGFYAQAYDFSAGTYRDLTRSGDYFFNTPDNSYLQIPKVFKSGSSIQLWPAHQSRPTPEHAVLRWTVPESNTYSLNGVFNRPSVGIIKVYVRINDESYIWSHDFSYSGNTVEFNLANIPLQKNDRLYFGVSAEENDAEGDYALLTGQITYNPVKRVSINVWDRFPDQQGENGFYAYAYQYGDKVYRLLTRTGDHYFGTPEQDYNIPYVSRGSSPWMIMHPSQDPACATHFPPEYSVLAWRPPQDNTYDLSGEFAQVEVIGGGDVTVYVWKNAEVLWSQPLTLAEPSKTFSLTNVTLLSTDRIYFGVNAGANDSNDTTQFKAQIAYNPHDTQAPVNFLLLE